MNTVQMKTGTDEPDSTNENIKDLLRQQTYDERMELAKWFQTAVVGWLQDQDPGYELTETDFSEWFKAYAEE